MTARHYNYFRDYDAGIGRYIEPDPLALRGLRAKSEQAARQESLLRSGRAGQSWYDSGFRANLFDYVDGNPLPKIDPTGEWGLFAVAWGAAAGAAGIIIWAIRDCAKKCEPSCPYLINNDPETEAKRMNWIKKCQWDCVGAFGELAKGGPW